MWLFYVKRYFDSSSYLISLSSAIWASLFKPWSLSNDAWSFELADCGVSACAVWNRRTVEVVITAHSFSASYLHQILEIIRFFAFLIAFEWDYWIWLIIKSRLRHEITDQKHLIDVSLVFVISFLLPNKCPPNIHTL